MSASVELKPVTGRKWTPRDQQRAAMLSAWLERHDLRRTKTVPLVSPAACPCQIGTSARAKRCNMLVLCEDGVMRKGPLRCHSMPGTWDHAEMFCRGRTRAIWTTEPYSYDKEQLVNLSATFGLAVVIHPRSESPYNPGGTHLIAVMRDDEVARYLAVEPNAVLLVVGGIVAVSGGGGGTP